MAPITTRKVFFLSTFVVALAIHKPRTHQGGSKALVSSVFGRGKETLVKAAAMVKENDSLVDESVAGHLGAKNVSTSERWSFLLAKHRDALAFGEAVVAATRPEGETVADWSDRTLPESAADADAEAAEAAAGNAYTSAQGEEKRNDAPAAEDGDALDGAVTVASRFKTGCILVAAATISFDITDSVWLLPFLADRGKYFYASFYCFWQAVMALLGYGLFVGSKSIDQVMPGLDMSSLLQAIGPVLLTFLTVILYYEWRMGAGHGQASCTAGEASMHAEHSWEGGKDGIAEKKGPSHRLEWIKMRRFFLITCAGCGDDFTLYMFMLVAGLADKWAVLAGCLIAAVFVVLMTFIALQIPPLARMVKCIPAFLIIGVIAVLADADFVSHLLRS